ncbi:site-specific DNA-methyltransferase [Vreelandella rituensis]|uniref:site-specific DNA-methyltransferase n=1 Tax=Vreelandella rituensis TaxID=2282306 RepID=UPI0015F0C523|nr:site-specific DNA-methyltransferase [Halomonas rituensis]
MADKTSEIFSRLDTMNEHELRRLLVQELTRKPLGLVWERDAIEHDRALNANVVLPRVDPTLSHLEPGASTGNLIIEGDNFDALRLLRKTHAGKIRVIYIDPPYNTGSKDWVYNDDYVSKTDRYRHSKWLEFLYQRLSLARDLLTSDGVIMISINDDNRAHLELLMDQVMPGRRVGSLVWRTRDTTSAKGRNFSDVHEHVLVYAGNDFAFNGQPKTQKKYKNPDDDPRGPWNGDPLTLAFDRFDRPNLYYPLYNPETDRWYACDESRVWAYASEARLNAGQSLQAETMEEFINRKQILFPADEKVVIWKNLEEIHAAIDSGDVPVTPKRKRPLFSRDTPNLEFWIGKKIGFGRPLFKKFWKDLRSHTNPLSSWIFRVNEMYDDEDYAAITSPNAGEGTELIQSIFGRKVFQYPKPPTLIRNLLSQTSNGNDIILDFFAGSGTTGQSVMELNERDGGNRRFILCSSTESTKKEPNKNLCRDICAERIRRVMAGQKGMEALGGSFAYLTLDLIEEADLALDVTPEHAQAMLSLRDTGAMHLPTEDAILDVGELEGVAILVCRTINTAVVEQLTAWPARRLVVYSPRPGSLQDALPGDMDVECRSIFEVFRQVSTPHPADMEVV